MRVTPLLHPIHVYTVCISPPPFLSQPLLLGRDATGFGACQPCAMAVEPAYPRINAEATSAVDTFTISLFFWFFDCIAD
jgi:hypothetical protein